MAYLYLKVKEEKILELFSGEVLQFKAGRASVIDRINIAEKAYKKS